MQLPTDWNSALARPFLPHMHVLVCGVLEVGWGLPTLALVCHLSKFGRRPTRPRQMVRGALKVVGCRTFVTKLRCIRGDPDNYSCANVAYRESATRHIVKRCHAINTINISVLLIFGKYPISGILDFGHPRFRAIPLPTLGVTCWAKVTRNNQSAARSRRNVCFWSLGLFIAFPFRSPLLSFPCSLSVPLFLPCYFPFPHSFGIIVCHFLSVVWPLFLSSVLPLWFYSVLGSCFAPSHESDPLRRPTFLLPGVV